LQELERELRRQGWVVRGDDGLTLSPKALRRLGNTALRTVFAELSGRRRGEHDLRDAGAAGEITGASRPWEYGDEQPLDVVRTVANAVRRAGASIPVRLAVEDFEVAETERRASAAVALCVDLSFSMISEGRWGPMKQTALALSHLVATKFPQDALQIIGFGRYAMRLSQQELAAVEPDMVQGTNLHHALRLAGRHLRKHPESEPVILVVTDGEPTAHLLGHGGRSRHADEVRGDAQHVHAGRGPRAAPVRGRGGPAQRRPGVHPGRRIPGPVRGERLPAGPPWSAGPLVESR
jgi:uncharacterized protein with von Willebrand factor type A (vWA) domain